MDLEVRLADDAVGVHRLPADGRHLPEESLDLKRGLLDALEVDRPAAVYRPLRGAGEITARLAFGEWTAVALNLDLRSGRIAEQPFDRVRLELAWYF